MSNCRHYGPMVFHLAWRKQLDDFLVDRIRRGHIEEAGQAVKIYKMVKFLAESKYIQLEACIARNCRIEKPTVLSQSVLQAAFGQ